MSYDTIKKSYSKEHINIVEIDVEYCGNTFGLAPCTATGSGDSKCYNCRSTCQDLPNFTESTKTYSFCEPRSPHPIGLAGVIPSLQSVGISPSRIDLKGGLGVRASVSLSFNDHLHSDIGVDPYLSERTFDAYGRGTFWTKFRSRNDNYQNRDLRVLSGYLLDGVFDIDNFETRYYIVDKMTVTDGKANINGKDPLKLASNGRGQAPAPSTGQLSASLTAGATSATLTPAGVGNAEYATSGHCLIKSEVMAFTRVDDILTLTRAQYNTVATDHGQNDTVQECLVVDSASLDDVLIDLLTNPNYYGNKQKPGKPINPVYINASSWSAEVSTYLSGLVNGIVAKPHDINKLLKELAENFPHFLWWNERTQEIELTALKQPPTSASVLDMDGNIIQNSFRTTDKPELRKSTVFVNFGQFDPTKKLDEPSNYLQSYARVDADSIAKYGNNSTQVINSRWIPNTNKAAALQLAALIGRRFSDVPREVKFSLEAKDSDTWVGQVKTVNHRDIVDASGLPVDTIYQIMSAKESRDFDYTGLEFTYGEALPEDEGGGAPGVDLIILVDEEKNVNLRTRYETLFPAPDASTIAKFIVEDGTIVGSSSSASYSIDTGSWPAGATVILQINSNGVLAGKGGDGGSIATPIGENGGHAILMSHDLEVVNNGILGGGGGGGGLATKIDSGATANVQGAGGAGWVNGVIGGFNVINGADVILTNNQPTNGANTSNGTRGQLEWEKSGNPNFLNGNAGGSLGQAGESSTHAGGSAGNAINKNGFTLTQSGGGITYGNIIG
jgi:hypothetical protein